MGTSERFACNRTEGVRLRTIHWGDPVRPLLVLLHGGGANAHWWDHLAQPLAQSFHVVALDFRGHGESDHPKDLKVGAFNDDLEELLEHLGNPHPILIGHSMGGHVALDHAARHPETRALVLLEIVGGATPRSRRVARLALSLRRSYRSREEAIRRYRFLPPAPGVSPTLRHAIATASVREESDGRFGFAFDPRWFSLPSRPRPALSSILCPTLLVRGETSDLLSPDGARAIIKEFPNARLCEIASAGHHAHLEEPSAALEILLEFLAPFA